MKKKINIIYLLGAGRSGTTMLTTVLNNHPKIFAVGEMHQFLDYVKDNKDCSCGAFLTDCLFWSQILQEIDVSKINNPEVVSFSNELEKHYNIPRHFINRVPNRSYSTIIDTVFETINRKVETPWILDSSKYIARYLLLKKNKNLNVKGIYMVRDIRGVIHSFGKNVQTPKKPLQAITYYCLINLWGELVNAFHRQVIKIRYEDFVDNPESVLKKIETHVFGEASLAPLKLKENTFDIPHIIAGNRLRSEKKIAIKKDIAWKENINRTKQIMYYILAFPFMILNKYKV